MQTLSRALNRLNLVYTWRVRRLKSRGETPPDSVSRSPIVALKHRDYSLFWGGQLISLTGTQMQVAAVAWQIYGISHSAISLGLIGLFRIIPVIVFSLTGGVVADALDRRRLLIVVQTFRLAVSVGFWATTVTGHASLPTLYALITLAGAAQSFDNPARQALVPSLVPRIHLANALSLMTMTWQFGTIIGPSLAGLLIAGWGVGTVYLVDVVSFVGVLVALLMIHPPPVIGAINKVSIRAAVEGLRFVAHTPILLSTMLLDFVATFFGSATSLLPIFARDILHVGSAGYGFLYAAPSIGAIAAGVVMSFVAGAIRKQGVVMIAAVLAYAVFTSLFGASTQFGLSLLALAGVGASDTVSMVLRQTVRQIVTPDALRGRMTSVGMVFFMGGPQLGEIEAGVVARELGAPFSVISGGVIALAATVLIAMRARGLRGYTFEVAVEVPRVG